VDDDLKKAGDDCDTDSEESRADKFRIFRVYQLTCKGIFNEEISLFIGQKIKNNWKEIK
jgi:hypothetical protein